MPQIKKFSRFVARILKIVLHTRKENKECKAIIIRKVNLMRSTKHSHLIEF